MAEVDEAARLHGEILVLDGLNPYALHDETIPEIRRGGYGAVHCTIGWMQGVHGTLRDVMWATRQIERHPELAQAGTAADIERIHASGRTAMFLGFQNTKPLAGDLDMIDVFHRLGVRVMQLTYNERNLVGDGCTERTDGGLSDFGVAAIERMNRVGVLVDLSHTGRRTTLEAIEVSRVPPVFSHSNAKALCDNPRNIDDEQIDAIVAKGGVIGLTSYGPFVKAGSDAPALNDYLDHIDYMVRRAGIDHVGIGLDINHAARAVMAEGVMLDPDRNRELRPLLTKPHAYPPDRRDFARGIDRLDAAPNVTRGLLARGYSADDVRKIWGGNFLRVYRQVWGA